MGRALQAVDHVAIENVLPIPSLRQRLV